MRRLLAPALVSAVAACGGGHEASSFGGMSQPGVTSAPESDSTTGASTSTGEPPAASTTDVSTSTAASTGDGSSTGDTVWDMGVPDFPVQPAGCRGKVDLLFVISSEGTMLPKQERLLAAFPGFIDAIETELPEFDVHILSANTNEEIKIDDCSVCTEGCDPNGEPPYCGGKFNICDKKIGSGVVFPTGPYASNRLCNLDSGLRYITSGQQDLTEAFSCIAQVGIWGEGVTAEAMIGALSPEINDPNDEDACNTGFLRDDALLVVTIIQDTYDVDSPGTAEDWIAALREAKHGDDDAFAVLVLTTDVDLGYGQLCLPDEYTPYWNQLRYLAEGVKHGFIGSGCMDSYAPFFAEHVGYLADLCDEFVPPG
jgi:hypothetical protein